MGLGIWLLWRSHVDLGRHWSPTLEVRDGHTLVTGGVFSRIRHPMYAAHWVWALGQILLLQNWIVGPSMLALFLPMYFYRVGREERMMLDHFGDEYRGYMKRTGRIVPRLWG
jgi:protein-S-isoprenylcysteine O-methyltransferase Ste14